MLHGRGLTKSYGERLRRRLKLQKSCRQGRIRRWCGRCPALDACVRSISEIPTLVIDSHRCYVISCKRNFFVTSDLYDAALTGGDLVERSAVLEFHRDNLITDAGFRVSFERIDKPSGNLS